MRMAYVAVGWEFGKLLHGLARSIRAKTIVEFGTSFGISTIFLASTIRDNGRGNSSPPSLRLQRWSEQERILPRPDS